MSEADQFRLIPWLLGGVFFVGVVLVVSIVLLIVKKFDRTIESSKEQADKSHRT